MNERQSVWILLFSSVLFGGILRFSPTLLSGTVINDGGMFYVMIEDLLANHLLLPAVTSYNHLLIPFAYPPLAFYIGGILSLLGIPLLDVFRWLPPVISTLCIPVFYWMARWMLNSPLKAALAALAYALMPRTFSWFVMGGGLSRSFGIFFLLLTCGCAWSLFRTHSIKAMILTALFGAAAVLSHPETGIHTAAACLLIWLANFRREVRTVRDAILVAVGVVVLTSPWWVIVLTDHGLAPFESAMGTGGHTAFFWVSWLTLDFAEERFITLLTVLGLIGLALQIGRREWFLPVWMLAAFAVEPRSAPAIAALPLAMLAGVGLADGVFPKLEAQRDPVEAGEVLRPGSLFQGAGPRAVLGCLIFLSFFGAYFYDLSLAQYVIPPQSRAAMDWAGKNTPAGSRFVVMSGASNPFSDPFIEWFPVFSGRTSLNTIQGQEWTLGRAFDPFLQSLAQLQGCTNDSPACVSNWASSQHLQFDFIYLEKPADNKTLQMSNLLLYQLRRDPGYALVFENGGAAIFARK